MTELYSLCQEVYQTIALKIMAAMHNGCTMREVYARNIDNPTSNQATYTQTPPYVGSKTGYKLPNQVAKSIEKKTGLTGRSHHGGIRISGLEVSEVDRDTITSALFTLLANIVVSMLANRVGGRFIPAVASKTLGDSRVITGLFVPHALVGSTDTRTQPTT